MPLHAVPPLKEFAIGVVSRAGAILLRNFSDSDKCAPREKSRREWVTKSDKEVHDFVRFKIMEHYSEHNFISEEGEPIDNGSDYTWLLDPLDGTLNYTIANPFFAVTLCVLYKDEPIVAVTYAPVMQEMFVVGKGGRTRLNECDVTVSSCDSFQNAVVSFADFSHQPADRRAAMDIWLRYAAASRAMRHLGCTSLELAYVACGRLDAVVLAPPVRMWDVAGGRLMVEAAGGRVTNFAGQPWKKQENGMILANQQIHRSVLEVIQST